jgi:RNA polymerase-interacting CarD/CdnL/TRCF family regulator
MAWKAGDWVYLPGVGVGRVTGVESEDEDQIYAIAFHRAGVRVLLADQFAALGLRDVVPASAIESIHAYLQSPSDSGAISPLAQRARTHAHRNRTGDPLQIASNLRELADVAARRSLSTVERAMAEQALTLLAEEVAAASGGDAGATRDQLVRMVGLLDLSPG